MNKDIRKQNSRKRNQIPFFILSIVLLVVLAVVIFIAGKGHDADCKDTEADIQSSSDNVEKWQEGVIKYDGKYYQYNNHIKTYLLMGIDKEKADISEVGEGGQSDAMFLLVLNDEAKTISVIAIHRNAMTDIDVYGDSGTILRTVKAQICTQYAFGDGKHLSCSRAVNAVSRLFYNLPITGYLSMQMGAIPILNDMVGGVEVEVLRDLKDESKGVDLKAGEVVTLTGNEAYVYLRSRDIEEFDSATNRLHRQEQYISGLAKQVDGEGKETLFEIHTDKTTVGEALLELELVAGEVQQYGLYIKSVNGITADFDVDKTYWAFYINDEYAQTGIDQTKIEEGTSYSLRVEK